MNKELRQATKALSQAVRRLQLADKRNLPASVKTALRADVARSRAALEALRK